MSKYIIAKAFTQSEWDGVDFAVIELTDGHLKFIREIRETIQKMGFKIGDGFLNIIFSGDNADFYYSEDELPEDLQPEEGKPLIATVEDPDIFKNLTRPEQDIRYGQLKFDEDGVQYVGYGKHTDEEFWIDRIPYDVILETEPVAK